MLFIVWYRVKELKSRYRYTTISPVEFSPVNEIVILVIYHVLFYKLTEIN